MEVTYSNENFANGKHKSSEPSKTDPGASAFANLFAPQDKPLSVVSKTSEQQSSQVFQFDSSVVLSISQLADTWLRSAVRDLEAFARYYNYYFFYRCTYFILEEIPFCTGMLIALPLILTMLSCLLVEILHWCDSHWEFEISE